MKTDSIFTPYLGDPSNMYRQRIPDMPLKSKGFDGRIMHRPRKRAGILPTGGRVSETSLLFVACPEERRMLATCLVWTFLERQI